MNALNVERVLSNHLFNKILSGTSLPAMLDFTRTPLELW